MTRTVVIFALCLLAAPASGHGTQDHSAHGAQAMTASRSTERLVLPDIAVTDLNGQSGGFVSRYAGQGTVIISFLYTNCTEVCAMTQAILGVVDEDLGTPGAPAARIVTITVDPVRDTPEVLARTARDQGASHRWDWLAASPADTPVLLAAFGLDPGPIEAHESVYLIGDLQRGDFVRIEGQPDPGALVDLARQVE